MPLMGNVVNNFYSPFAECLFCFVFFLHFRQKKKLKLFLLKFMIFLI